ncbi:hypothetical protein BDZ89DRAFT_1070768 [Hymenopellis radicata]|nr:hypothetical protein BDZ89DRAFT_1070768 [Hymenopellis radicata]
MTRLGRTANQLRANGTKWKDPMVRSARWAHRASLLANTQVTGAETYFGHEVVEIVLGAKTFAKLLACCSHHRSREEAAALT